MKAFACLLLGLAAVAAGTAGAESTTTAAPAAAAPADTAPAAPDDQTLAQQLVYCGIVAQKLGGKRQKAWIASYGSAAVALSSTAFVTMQMLAQTGSADQLSPEDLQSASDQCQQTMLTNSARIGAAMQSKQGGAAGQ
jgi:hypothetical protein